MVSNILKVLFLLTFLNLTYCFYSINYSSNDGPQLMGTAGSFTEPPSAEHVADMFARLSGLPPLLHEDTLNLPTTDILADHSRRPMIVEVHGGRLPPSVSKVMGASAFENNARGPSLESVLGVLKSHGIEAESLVMEGTEDLAQSMTQWMKSQSGPVFVLHHETPAAHHYIQRALATSSVTPLTEFQISQYQICLWAAVIFVSTAGAAICAVVNMEVIPDSLLFAKFMSSRTHKND